MTYNPSMLALTLINEWTFDKEVIDFSFDITDLNKIYDLLILKTNLYGDKIFLNNITLSNGFKPSLLKILSNTFSSLDNNLISADINNNFYFHSNKPVSGFIRLYVL